MAAGQYFGHAASPAPIGRAFADSQGVYLASITTEFIGVALEQIAKAPVGCSIPIWARRGAPRARATVGDIRR